MKLKKLIPFRFLPGSWGLSGKTRLIAEAEYYYTGIDLEKRLAEINAEDELSSEIEKLAIDLRHEIISEQQFNRKKADLMDEPYVEVVKIGLTENDPNNGYVELDWNDQFVELLQGYGIKGISDDEIVNKWFNQLCRTVILQEMNDQDYGLQDVREEQE